MSVATEDNTVTRVARRAALRTALVLGAVALGFFIAAFIWLPR